MVLIDGNKFILFIAKHQEQSYFMKKDEVALLTSWPNCC